ncbi:MAG: hypothetical protein ACLP1X_06015 [Polyangiaceae bacterium]
MSDPTRLGDPRSESPASLRGMIEAGRSDVPDTERLRAMAGRLGFGVGAAPAGAAAVKGAAVGLGGATKIGAVAVLVLGAGAGVLAARNVTNVPPTVLTTSSATGSSFVSSTPSRLEPQVAPAAPSSRGEEIPPTEQAPLAPATSLARGAPSEAVVSATSVMGTTPRDGTAAGTPAAALGALPVATGGSDGLTSLSRHPPAETEFSLLEQAQRALHGDPQGALDLTDRDAREYPSGALAQEREVIAIEALVQLGRAGEARVRGRSFFQAFPGSAHAPRIAALLGLDAGVHNP